MPSPIFKKLEIWNDLKCMGGTRVWFVREVLSLATTRTLDNQDQLQLSVPLNSAAVANLTRLNVLRVAFVDETFDEWRITKVQKDRARNLVNVTAEWPLVDLNTRAEPCSTAALTLDAQSPYSFEAVSVKPSDHFDNYITRGFPAAWSGKIAKGIFDPIEPIDLVYDWAKPLKIIQDIAKITDTEIDYRRNGTTSYLLDFLNARGGSLPILDVRLGKNLLGMTTAEDENRRATTIFPRSALIDGVSYGLAQNRWEIVAVNAGAKTIDLADPAGGAGPIAFDNQFGLTGLAVTVWERYPSGAKWVVNSSTVANQRLTLATDPSTGLQVGDWVVIGFQDGGGNYTPLWKLNDGPQTRPDPPVAVLQRDDIGSVLNYCPNPVMRKWTNPALPPDSWAMTAVPASPTITKETASSNFQSGGFSCRVQTTAADVGLVSPVVGIKPTVDQPYFVSYFSFRINALTGGAKVKVVLKTLASGIEYPINTVPWQSFPNSAGSNQIGPWITVAIGATLWDSVGIPGVSPDQLRLYILQDGTGTADFTVDACQVTQTSYQQPLIEGSGANRLWQAANEFLVERHNPQVEYRMDLADLSAANPTLFATDPSLEVGQTLRVTDTGLGLTAVPLRVISLTREHVTNGSLTPANVRLTIGLKNKTASALFADPTLSSRQGTTASQGAVGSRVGVAPLPQDPGLTNTSSAIYVTIQTDAALRGAIASAAAGATIRVADGTWLIDPIAITKPLNLELQPGTIIKANSGLTATGLITFRGARSGTTTTLTAVAKDKDQSLSLTSATNFPAGTWIRIEDTAADSLNKTVEFHQVKRTVGNVVYLNEPLELPVTYPTASTVVEVWLPVVGARISGGTFDDNNLVLGVNLDHSCVQFEHCVDFECVNTTHKNWRYYGIKVFESRAGDIHHNWVQPSTGDLSVAGAGSDAGYGITVDDHSCHIHADHNRVEACRHQIIFGRWCHHFSANDNDLIGTYTAALFTHGRRLLEFAFNDNRIMGATIKSPTDNTLPTLARGIILEQGSGTNFPDCRGTITGNVIHNMIGAAIQITGLSAALPTHVVVEGNTFVDCYSTTDLSHATVYLGQCKHIEIGSNIYVRRTGDLIYPHLKINACNDISVSGGRMYFELTQTTAVPAIQIIDSKRIQVDGVIMNVPGATCRGFSVSSTASGDTDDLTITGCEAYGVAAGNEVNISSNATNVSIHDNGWQSPDMVSADRGNASVTLTVGTDRQTQMFATPLTANRTVTISTSRAYNGDKFRIVRAYTATGNFTLSVFGSAFLTPGMYADVQFNGTAWVITATGGLAPRNDGVHVEDYGAVGDDATDDTTALQNAATAAGTGKLILQPNKTYKITAAVTVSGEVEGNFSTIRQATTATVGLTVGGDNVRIRRLGLKGPQFAALTQTEIGIACNGGSVAGTRRGLRITDCTIWNWGGYGVKLDWSDDFEIASCNIYDAQYAGIMGLSSTRGRIQRNWIHHIIGNPLGYGISLTRNQVDSLVTNPRSAYVLVDNNLVEDVTSWEGLDTHGGQAIQFRDNVVLFCEVGIALPPADGTAGSPMYASIDCLVADNHIDSGSTAGTKGYGIVHTGVVSGEQGTGSIMDNMVIGHGDQATDTVGGITFYDTIGMRVQGNVVQECSPHGIAAYARNADFTVTDNTIIDPWSNAVAISSAIMVRTGIADGVISNNKLAVGTLSGKTYLNNRGLSIESTAAVSLMVHGNLFENAATGYAGAGLTTCTFLNWEVYGSINLPDVSGRISVGGGRNSAIGIYLRNGALLGGATTARGIYADPTFDSGVTVLATAITGRVNLDAAAFTVSQAVGCYVLDAIKGAGSAITTQYGLRVADQTQGATNYAVYTGLGLVRFGEGVTIATGGLEVTAGDVAIVDPAARVVIGASTAQTTIGLDVRPTLVLTGGTTQISVYGAATYNSSCTAVGDAIRGRVQTQAAAFTLTTACALHAVDGVKGAGSTITNLYGLKVDDQTVGTNNFAIKTGLGTVDLGDLTIVRAQLQSTVSTGTAPFIVASTTKVANLNADKLDDLDSTAFMLSSSGTTGTLAKFTGASTIGDSIMSESGTMITVAGGITLGPNRLIANTLTHQPGAGLDGSLVLVGGTITEAASGTHAILAGLRVNIPTITGGVATVTDTATVYIVGAPSATVTGSNKALWVVAGESCFGGLINMTAAAARISGGATSFAIRDNANAADNLIITDAGAATVRAGLTITAGGLTVTSGGITITAGNITMAAAASRLVPGATSFAIRNTANGSDNLLVNDAGDVTIRGGTAGLTVTAGGITVTAGGIDVVAGGITMDAGGLTVSANRIVGTALTQSPAAGSNGALVTLGGTLTEAGSGTHTRMSLMELAIPTLTAGAATVTNATTLYVAGAPSGGTTNRALWVAAGLAELGGGLTISAGNLTISTGDQTITAGNLALSDPAARVAMGGSINTAIGLYQRNTLLLGGATTARGVYADPTFDSGVTTLAAALTGRVNTQAAAFTVSQAVGCYVLDAIKGAGSTITTQYGVRIADQTQGATNYSIFTGLGLAHFGDSVEAPRYFGKGTAHVAGDYALSAGWGTTATVASVGANDQGGRVVITSSGTGQAANPTVTLTFKDGTWSVAPAVVCCRGNTTTPTGEFTCAPTATTAVFTFLGTPVAGTNYTFNFVCMGIA